MHCQACRKPLTNEVSIRYGFGPSCLKRAVAAGNAPLVALEEQTAMRREVAKQRKAKPSITFENHSADLFASARRAAIELLHLAQRECESLGMRVTLSIEE